MVGVEIMRLDVGGLINRGETGGLARFIRSRVTSV